MSTLASDVENDATETSLKVRVNSDRNLATSSGLLETTASEKGEITLAAESDNNNVVKIASMDQLTISEEFGASRKMEGASSYEFLLDW